MGREWSWSRSFRRGESEKETTAPPGCMSGVLQLFDLHQLLFSTTAHSRTEGDSFPRDQRRRSLKGVEAPRNSLEMDEATVSSASVAIAGEEEYDIPIGIQLVPKKKKKTSVAEEEQQEVGEKSPQGPTRTRTGNAVARLMGLDQLPDQGPSPPPAVYYRLEPLLSPPLIRTHLNYKTKKQHMDACGRESTMTPPPRHPLQARNCNILEMPEEVRQGTRSLPDTPRMSSARRSSDTDPRHSLQLSNKENAASVVLKDSSCFCDVPGDYSSLSPSPLFSKSKRKDWRHLPDENRSPGHYAREIVKQVKDSVSRRIGGRDCDDLSIRSNGGTTKGPEKKTRGESNKNRTSTTPSCSPRLRFLESPKNKSTTPAPDDHHIPSSSPELVPKYSPPPPPPLRPSCRPYSPPLKDGDIVTPDTKAVESAAKCKKASCERFNERLKRPPTAIVREETFVSSCSSGHLQKKCRSPSAMATYVPSMRKEPPTSPPQPQVHISAPPLLRNTGHLLKCDDSDSREGSNSRASAGPEEYWYVRCILERAGVHGGTPLPFASARWYSPSHPVDPIIFHQLERSFHHPSGPLRQRCNRKLLFHLVDEVLADLLWPYLHTTAWPSRSSGFSIKKRLQKRMLDGEALLQRLWSQIRSFPSADCRVVEDIDALVEWDLPAANVRRLLLHPSVSDEAESIASELESAILDSLLGDAAAAMLTSL